MILKYSNSFLVSTCNSGTPPKNIISGHIVPYNFKNDIINAFDLGKEETEKFVKVRFFEELVAFLEKVKKLNLHTFLDENKSLQVRNLLLFSKTINFFSRDYQQLVLNKILT